jgi:hypothetical protein
MVDKVRQEALKTAQIDISEFTGELPGTDVITYQEPTTAQLFQLPEDALAARKRFPEWPESLCQMVALLSLSHVAPQDETPIGLIYCQLADDPQKRDLWLYLVSEWNAKFPSLSNLGEKVAAEKNDDGHSVQSDDAVHRASAPDARRVDQPAGLGDGAALGVAQSAGVAEELEAEDADHYA